MLRILTACSLKHEPYLQSCKDSVATIKQPHEHLVSFGDSPKHIHMNRLLKKVNDDDIVLVLDADDAIISNISLSLFFIDLHDLVYRDVYNVDKNGNSEIYKSQDFDIDVFRNINFIPYSGTMLKGWLAKSEPYPDTFHANDWRWWASLLKHTDRFKYVSGTFVSRRNWTSYKRCNIPVYRKLRRLYYNHRAKQDINAIYEDIKKNK